MTQATQRSPYRGRFAPSPSGPLHFGSLVAALGSYLDAKSNHGKWLLRIEDIDPPREQAGSDKLILSSLENFGLYWDETVLYQSSRSAAYQQLIEQLLSDNLAYFCRCTRADIKAMGGHYNGRCQTLNLSAENSAVRLNNQHPIFQFTDIFQQSVSIMPAFAKEDFIIKRRDGLFAYQLAVVLDDAHQGINHVIRGADLLTTTAKQLSLFNTLKLPQPIYGHLPVAATKPGYKLSKQNHATAIDNNQVVKLLIKALDFLGQRPIKALTEANKEEVLAWAIQNWQRAKVPKKAEIIVSE